MSLSEFALRGPLYRAAIFASPNEQTVFMALMLCHQCLSWVEPLGEQCPQCDFPLDARIPDPTSEELGAVIGKLVRRIGDVRIARTALPNHGSLYETTRGLFFVPHRLEDVRLVHGAATLGGWRSVLSALQRIPYAVFGLRGYRAAPRVEIAVDVHTQLNPQDSKELPNLLMSNPGVFFLSRRSIHRIQRTLWGWMISRPNSLSLRLKPLAERSEFHQRMSAFADGIREAVCP